MDRAMRDTQTVPTANAMPTLVWSDTRWTEANADGAAEELESGEAAMLAWAILDVVTRRPGLLEYEIGDALIDAAKAIGGWTETLFGLGDEQMAAAVFARARWGVSPRCPQC